MNNDLEKMWEELSEHLLGQTDDSTAKPQSG
jgi:hypothetical protein